MREKSLSDLVMVCRRHGIMKWPRRELLKTARRQQEEERKAAESRPAPSATRSQGSEPHASTQEGVQQDPMQQFQQKSLAASRGYASTGNLDSHSSVSIRLSQRLWSVQICCYFVLANMVAVLYIIYNAS